MYFDVNYITIVVKKKKMEVQINCAGEMLNVKFKVIYSVANISSITCYYGSNVFVIGIQEIHLVSC